MHLMMLLSAYFQALLLSQLFPGGLQLSATSMCFCFLADGRAYAIVLRPSSVAFCRRRLSSVRNVLWLNGEF